MKLTVIVPVYNAGKFLGRCVDSICNQTFRNLEIVLIDDGSTDDSGILCDQYKKRDTRIKIIHKSNEGPISARESGVKVATGDYITFVDSDDWLEPRMYEELMGVFLQFPNVDIVIGGYVLEKNGVTEKAFHAQADKIMGLSVALYHMYEAHLFNWSLCDKIYRSSLVVEKYDWVTQNPYGEDAEYNWILFNRALCIFLHPIYMYHYVQNKSSIMHQPFSPNFFAYLDRLLYIINQINAKDELVYDGLTKRFCLECMGYLKKLVTLQEDHSHTIGKYRKELIRISDKSNWTYTERQKILFRILTYDFEDPLHLCQKIQNEFYEKYKDFRESHGYIYIYGVGQYGKKVADFMIRRGLYFSGFVVSMHRDMKPYRGYSIMQLDDVFQRYGERVGFILGLGDNNTDEVISELRNRYISNYIDLGVYADFLCSI